MKYSFEEMLIRKFYFFQTNSSNYVVVLYVMISLLTLNERHEVLIYVIYITTFTKSSANAGCFDRRKVKQ